jgi:raffinose/stachyose/melibiose transport system substrate-binding protein
MTFNLRRRTVLFAAALTLSTALAAPAFAADPLTLSFLVDNAPNTVAWANQLKADFEAANPDIKIEIEQRPGGADGDNLIKTKLATGDMSDVFNYNSGSLFQQIRPTYCPRSSRS